jgi:hypothetical protein
MGGGENVTRFMRKGVGHQLDAKITTLRDETLNPYTGALQNQLLQTSNKKPRGKNRGALCWKFVKRMKQSVLCRPGSDLLFQVLRLSTIGAEDFDGRVRDGIG